MLIRNSFRRLQVLALVLSCCSAVSIVQAQGAKQTTPQNPIPDSDGDHTKERNEWFYRGRLVRGQPSAELRRQAYQGKLQMRARHAAAMAATARINVQVASPSVPWTPLGPMPLASDASGNGTQDYHQVSGRATAVAIDPADPTGNTIYIGGAQSGVWKSNNAANNVAGSVTWTPITDDQATLSIGAIAIQAGNSDPTKTVILAATGEADNSGDSYFGLGILRSADAGTTWTLIPTANSGALSFSGLGGTRMAFSTTSGQMNTVVAAMATTSEGVIDGAVNANTTRGLYTSLDAGLTWTYNALLDSGVATDATSATSVVYNVSAGLFFAAVRYHGLYSSPDGTHWTRLAVQPGGAVLRAAACPPQSTSNGYACPIYRAEITVVPGRNEMYAWVISLSGGGSPVDGGIWQSLNGGASWTSISDASITYCGDVYGCGAQQGSYNLELLAVPNGGATDLYAGAINLYKCGITTQNPTCAASPFMNLTHVYGCDPVGAPAHVHPDQHALAYAIPTSGSDAGNALMYFANDGGIYRALNGFSGLNTGSCSGTNQFDDLNQNLGSMTQFVSFSQHPTDPNTLLGGAQDNGSPATAVATTSLSWVNVLGGDGGYNAIDPGVPLNWYASNPDIPPGGLGVQLCASGVNCNNSGSSFVVTSNTVGGDDGAFYFPYILDPKSTAMLVGTCRVWRGSRAGGVFTALSPNFETLGSGTCLGSEINQVRSLAVGGPADSNGSDVIYATTSGLGPLEGPLNTPAGGHVWVTTNATAGVPAFVDVTSNGPQGTINPNQFPVSGVATDSSDLTGSTAYVTVMGFTGGAGHVWKTNNAGAAWTDFTGNLPDSPVNAVVVYSAMAQVYVATDVGVFSSSTSAPNWTEVGPNPAAHQPGFLPNVAVTGLGVFASGGQQLLRASTYGRGIWQFNLVATPDFQISITNSPLTISDGGTATFTGSAAALNGYSGTVTLSCAADGGAAVPATCGSPQSPLKPGINTAFSVTASGAVGDYYFNVQGVSSDVNHTTHTAGAELHILSNAPDFALSQTSPFPTVNAGSSTTSGPISVTGSSGFAGTINLTCALVSGSGSCSISPTTVTSIPTTAYVTVNAPTLIAGSYQLLVQGISGATTHSLRVLFNVGDYQLSGAQSLTLAPGIQGTANLTVTASTYYSGNINANCTVSSLPGGNCAVTPPNPIVVSTGSTVPLVATISVPNNAASGTYNVSVDTQDTTATPSHSFAFSLTVGQDFKIASSTASQTVAAGQTSGLYNLSIQSAGTSFSSAVTLSCSSGLPAGAQCLFTPSTPVTPGSVSVPVGMSISTGAPTSAGTYSVTVTGIAGSLSHSTTVLLTLTKTVGNSNDFQVAVAQPFPPGVAAGSQVQAHVSVTSNYGGSINASCDASAISGQCVITPSNPIAISASGPTSLVITVNIPNTVTPATYNINLTASDSSGQPSRTFLLTLMVIQDFSVTSATPTQTLKAGQSGGAYQLTVAPNPFGSSFAGAVTLSCPSGLPTGAQCLFAPSATVTVGTGPAAVVMSISTVARTAALGGPLGYSTFYALWLLLPGIVVIWSAGCIRSPRSKASVLKLIAMLLLLTLSLLSCGGVSNGSTTTTTGNKPILYQITVTGTSPGTAPDAGQSAVVTLVVN